jgi:hypothetical protein
MSFRHSTALLTAITLFVAPIGAQSFDTPQSSTAPAKAPLLSPAAFARLVQPPTDSGPPPDAGDHQRLDLLRQGQAAMVRQARSATAEPPRRKSAGWGTKTLAVLIVVGAMVGLAAAHYYGGGDPVGITNPPSGK